MYKRELGSIQYIYLGIKEYRLQERAKKYPVYIYLGIRVYGRELGSIQYINLGIKVYKRELGSI